MKLNQFVRISALGLVVAFGAVGCKTTPPPLTQIPPDSQDDKAFAKLPPGQPVDGSEKTHSKDENLAVSHRNFQGWKENSELFAAYTVHFEYDSSVVKESEKPKLDAVASQMKSSPSSALKVEGFCDERGTEEYNRSLGERRALALREQLASLGVDSTRVETISYGDLKPVAQGHDEAAWSQNRRGEFVQLTPPK